MEFYQLLYFSKNCVSVEEPLTKSWFDVPTTQMSIFILFLRVGITVEGAFSLWLSLS